MWKLTKQEDGKRVYTDSTTGSKCNQSKCYTDKDGNEWFLFDDVMSMPYTRNFAAAKINSLYSLGLSKEDMNKHIDGLKKILNSDDKEKYQKAYANILEFETMANAADPVKQMSSLVCVYFTINDEPIDSFQNDLQIKKMFLLEADIEMHSFFLNKQIKFTQDYTQSYAMLSRIVSASSNGK